MLDWLCVILSVPYEPAVGLIIAVGCPWVCVCFCVSVCCGLFWVGAAFDGLLFCIIGVSLSKPHIGEYNSAAGDGGVSCCWARPAYRTSLFVATKMASATEEQWRLKFSPQGASDDSTIPLTWLHVCVFHLAPHIGFLLLNPTLG